MTPFSSIIVLLGLASLVSGHGFLKSITVNGKNYLAWQVGQDDFVSPAPVRYARKLTNNGPVPDFTTKDITCGAGGNIPAQGIIELKAGDKVTFNWDQWGSSHSGPVFTYIARCANNDCKTFKGDTGNIWVKIDQLSYNPQGRPPWHPISSVNKVPSGPSSFHQSWHRENICFAMRFLGLHVAERRLGAQFYPSCTQIRVTQGGTTQLPEGVALPGAYKPEDPGILAALWKIQQGQTKYVAPGGPVWSEAAPNANRAGV